MIRVHFVQQVPFETPACLEELTEAHACSCSYSRLYENAHFPPISSFDLLIIMGGPMNIYEEKTHPWLKDEKQFIEKAIRANKKVLGICLGAQLLADVLGANVTQNRFKEIGWFPVHLTGEGDECRLCQGFSKTFTPFHWHGDTFSIPNGAKRIAWSEACENQGFVYDDHVVALQFHLETTKKSMQELIGNCRNELEDNAPYIQKSQDLQKKGELFIADSNKLLGTLFNNLIS